MVAQEDVMTAQQLLEARNLGPCELVCGRLVRLPYTQWREGLIASRLLGFLFDFVKPRALGVLVGGRTGFQIGWDPDTVRTAQVAFVCCDRIPSERETGYFQGPPDLAVEVVSPNDRADELLSKVQDWLAAGCRTVWVVDPNSQTISVYRGSHETKLLTVDDELTDEELLPGFRLPLSEVF
jgi:Uma2 family endonuclease